MCVWGVCVCVNYMYVFFGEEVWTHEYSLTPPLLLMCLYQAMKEGIDFASIVAILGEGVGFDPTVWYFVLLLYANKQKCP